MRRNAVPSFAALASVLVTTLVLGVFIPVVQATNGAANDVRGRVLVDVDLTTSAIARGSRARARASSNTRRTSRASSSSPSSRAMKQERKLNPQAFALIGYNPLPDIFRVTPDNPDDTGALRAELDQAARSARAW